MKKVLGIVLGVVSVTLTLGSISLAKVSDFHSLITENISAQKELHGEVRKQMKVTQESLNPGAASTMIVESDQTQINSPTSAKMLRFRREASTNRPSQKKQMDRVSQEFSESNKPL